MGRKSRTKQARVAVAPSAAAAGPSAPERTSPPRLAALLVAVLAVTAATFSGSIGNGFTRWDDPLYVTENEAIDRIDPALFRSYVAGNYHPVTMLSYAADVRLFGKRPAAFHATSLALHLAVTAVVFFLLLRLLRSDVLAAAGALLFAVHPMRVEPVAWVSGRKELLYALFYLAGLLAWIGFIRGRRRALAWTAALLLFALALLSKAVAVTFPVAILLVDLAERRRIGWNMLVEKIPFFALSIAFGLVAIDAQRAASAIAAQEVFPLLQRVAFAGYGSLLYLVRFAVPAGLSAFYPYPIRPGEGLTPMLVAAPAIAAAIAVAAIWLWRRQRVAAFGAALFFVALAPVAQLVTVGSAVMADRYTYLPHVGLVVALLAPVAASRRDRWVRGAAVIAAVAALAFAVASHHRVALWGDEERLWSDAIAKDPARNATAYSMRARQRIARGEMDRAAADLDAALRIDPALPDALVNRGIMRAMRKEFGPALEDLDHAVRAAPHKFDSWFNRGLARKDAGRPRDAIEDFARAAEIRPRSVEVALARADALAALGDVAAAIAEYDAMLSRDPSHRHVLLGRAVAYFRQGRHDAAERDLTAALEIAADGDTYHRRAVVRLTRGDRDGATRDAAEAEARGRALDPALASALGR